MAYKTHPYLTQSHSDGKFRESVVKETYMHTMYTHIIEFLMCYLLGFVSKTKYTSLQRN